MEEVKMPETAQASVTTDLRNGASETSLSMSGSCSRADSGDNTASVLVELLRQVPPLRSEEPEVIMQLFVALDEIHDLNLANDQIFVTRILPLVSGSLLKFFGRCLRERRDWINCKSALLEEYFPYFVRERLIRDLIVFNLQREGQSVRAYAEQVFGVAKFLEYEASEAELVDRVVMNFHPSILEHAVFVDKPRTVKELYRAIGVLEEKSAVAKERRRIEFESRSLKPRGAKVSDSPRASSGRTATPATAQYRCWDCGSFGHIRRNCPRRSQPSGKRAVARGSVDSRAGVLGGLERTAVKPENGLLWVPLKFKVGEVPAVIDTGAQFSCVRQDVADFLHLVGEKCVFSPCSLSCILADGQRCDVMRTVEFHVKLLEFTWNHEFKVLKGGPFPAILGMDFLSRTQMTIDPALRKFGFGFAPDCVGAALTNTKDKSREPFLQALKDEISEMSSSSLQWPARGRVQSLMGEFQALFSPNLGTANCVPYEIELSDRTPVRSPPYRCAPPKMEIFRDLVNDLLRQGVVRPSKSPYASPAFLVPKKEGGFRLVVDYRKVNSKVVFDSYPLPTIEQALEQFGGAAVFSVLDLNSAYFQIPLSSKSRRVTAFCTPFGLFEFNKLPMGISVGCQGLSRVIDELFADLKGKWVFNFMDDLVVYSRSMEDHVPQLREVLSRLQRAGFTLNPEKITLAATEIKFLGHLLSARGVRVIPDRVAAIKNYSRPVNLRALRRFVGMVGFYARFIPDFSGKAAALHRLKKKGVDFVWEEEQQEAFESLKRALCEAPVLQIPDFSKEFVLATDASDFAVSAVLHQRVNGELAPIAYHSRLLVAAEKGYSTYEKECLAVVFGCEKARVYLEHKEFELRCDNLALCWLLRRPKDVGRLGRWILRLAPFKFKVVHTRGVDNVVADALSRMFEGSREEAPEVTCGALLESLPLVYTSLEEHQREDLFCKGLKDQFSANPVGEGKFRIHRGLWCYAPKGSKRRRWIIPPSLRSMCLKYFHDSVLSGHLGARKTFQKIATNFWWPGMRNDVFQYVRKCELCQRAKPAQDANVGMHSSHPCSRPMERLFMDFVGPLTRTKRGNIAILVIVDAFSKFVFFHPVRKMTSQVVTECLERQVFPAYGTPCSIVTDNARAFCCRQFKDLCFRWGVTHLTTTPYYPQASLAERVNRNLKAALKIFHHKSQTTWDVDLPWLSVAFNTAVHESTNSTPDLLFLGRELMCPLKIKWDLSPVNGNDPEHNSQLFWTRAYANLVKARDKVAKRYDARRQPHKYKVNDTVVYRKNLVSSKTQNVSAKLMLRWSEPVVVARILRPNVMLLANPDTGVIIRRAHVSQLKPYVK
jgi:hypothetical protein